MWRISLPPRVAAIGAAVAVALGAGGLLVADAASTPPSDTVLIDPVRILDTRDPVNIGLPGPFVSPVGQKLQVTGSVATTSGSRTVVPAGASGVVLNVTAVNPAADGWISVRPGDATGAPKTSSLNVTARTTVPNAVTVALPTSGPHAGKIDITWDALGRSGPTTDILVDVVGYMQAVESATQAFSSSGPLATPDYYFGERTVTTTRPGHLQLSWIGRGHLACTTSTTFHAWIEVDEIVVPSSPVIVGDDIFAPQLVLQGVTDTPILPGNHSLRVVVACSTGDWSIGQSSSIHSWVVTVLDGTPASAALQAPAEPVGEAPPVHCETVGDAITCTPA